MDDNTKLINTLSFFNKVWNSTEYKEWKKTIPINYIDKYRKQRDIGSVSIEKVYWLAFMAENDGRRYLRYLLYERTIHSLCGDDCWESIKNIVGTPWHKVLRSVALDVRRRSVKYGHKKGRP